MEILPGSEKCAHLSCVGAVGFVHGDAPQELIGTMGPLCILSLPTKNTMQTWGEVSKVFHGIRMMHELGLHCLEFSWISSFWTRTGAGWRGVSLISFSFLSTSAVTEPLALCTRTHTHIPIQSCAMAVVTQPGSDRARARTHISLTPKPTSFPLGVETIIFIHKSV